MRSFVLIVADRDARTFTVEGPMTDDRPWNSEVVALQRQGRSVGCHTPGVPGEVTVEDAASAYAREYGYTRLPPGSIVSAPI